MFQEYLHSYNFDLKHNGRYYARFVADGYFIDILSNSVYSGVVSLHGFRMALLLARLNGFEHREKIQVAHV